MGENEFITTAITTHEHPPTIHQKSVPSIESLLDLLLNSNDENEFEKNSSILIDQLIKESEARPQILLNYLQKIDSSLDINQNKENVKKLKILLLREQYQIIFDALKADPNLVQNDPQVIKTYHALKDFVYSDVTAELVESYKNGEATQLFLEVLTSIEKTLNSHPYALPQEFEGLLHFRSQIEELTVAPPDPLNRRIIFKLKRLKKNFAKKYWRYILGFNLLISSTAVAVDHTKDTLNDPVQRGRITQKIDEGLRRYLEPSTAQFVRDWLDDTQEFYSGEEPNDPPASFLNILEDDPSSAYQEEKTKYDRMQQASGVISKYFDTIISFSDSEEHQEEFTQNEQSIFEYRENLLDQDITTLTEIFQEQHKELYDQNPELATSLLKLLYAYQKLSVSQSHKLIEHKGELLLIQTKDNTVNILFDEENKERNILIQLTADILIQSQKPLNNDGIQKLFTTETHSVVGRALPVILQSLLISQQSAYPQINSQELLSEFILYQLSRITNPREILILNPAEWDNNLLDDWHVQSYDNLGANITSNNTVLGDVPIMVRYDLINNEDQESIRQLQHIHPELSTKQISRFINWSRHIKRNYVIGNSIQMRDEPNIVEIYDLTSLLISGLKDQHDHTISSYKAINIVNAIYNENNTPDIIGEKMPSFEVLSKNEIAQFVISNNLNGSQLQEIQAMRINLSIQQQEAVSYEQALQHIKTSTTLLGLQYPSDLDLVLAINHLFPAGNSNTEKIQVIKQNVFDSGFLIFNIGTKNTIQLDDFIKEANVFVKNNIQYFSSKQEALKFFTATKPALTEIAAADTQELETITNELLLLYGDSFKTVNSDRLSPETSILKWNQVISELSTGGKIIASLYEFDTLIKSKDVQSFDIGELSGKIVPLTTQARFGILDEEKTQTDLTQLPLVFFEPGSDTKPLSSLFVNNNGTVESLKESLAPEELNRNLWVFDSSGLSHIPMYELGSNNQEVAEKLEQRDGFTTAFAPSNLIWDANELDLKVIDQRIQDANFGNNPTYIVSYTNSLGNLELAAIHTQGHISSDYFPSSDELIEEFNDFIYTIESQIDGEIQEIVRCDPEISTQISVTNGDEVISYSYRVPLPSEFSQSGTKAKLLLLPFD